MCLNLSHLSFPKVRHHQNQDLPLHLATEVHAFPPLRFEHVYTWGRPLLLDRLFKVHTVAVCSRGLDSVCGASLSIVIDSAR